jgi:DNA-binding transcriptional LysR family regulator
MDKFEDLQAFVSVVESGSFTAAAERLDADKSAISRRVSSLEEHLGVQLMRRTTRSLNLTDTGRSFYERSARILADLEEAESAVAQEHIELKGRLRVALPLSFGVLHMGPPIDAFSQLHPRVEFDLDLNDRQVDLLREDIDVAVRIGILSDSSLIARRLFRTRVVVCASPGYLEKNGTPATPDDLQDHRCLVYSNLRDPGHWSWLDTEGVEQRVPVKVAMQANNGNLLTIAASDGLGIVMQPTFIAHEAIKAGDLVPILTEHAWPGATAYAVYPPARHLSHRVRAFIDFLADQFAATPYWDRDSEIPKPGS